MHAKEYQPFGEEWKKEVKKWNKDLLIDLLRKTLIENKAYADQAQMPSNTPSEEFIDTIQYFINGLANVTATPPDSDMEGYNADLVRLSILQDWLKSLQPKQEKSNQ